MTGETVQRLGIGAALVVVTFAALWPVLGNDFTNYDDDQYVTENARVIDGLTLEGIRWALTATDNANWHPMTWLSHMADCELWGLDPRGHHLTSLLLHAANTLLLFVLFQRMTRATWRSATVAALFALHPLHVESVAWVAERKDVLTTFFGLAATLAYVRYVEAPRPPRYALVAALFVLALASKPMMVTLPFLLVLLDVWPLRRFGRFRPALVWEKVPLVALAAVSSAITLFAQREGRALGGFEQYSWPARWGNAVVSYAAYFLKTLWPADLAVFYPHAEGALPGWKIAGAAALLAAVSALALRERRRHPYLLVGWLWYLGTLVPVLGIVQVGEQARADRYTYVPLIGLFVIAVWGSADLLKAQVRRPAARAALAGALLITLFGIGAASFRQARTWRDSFSLFEHALAATHENHVAHINLGLALSARGDIAEAAAHFASAVSSKPGYSIARNNYGAMLARQGKWSEAIEQYRAALTLDPGYAQARENLAVALVAAGRFEEAAAQFEWIARLRPENARSFYDWGTALAQARHWDDAIARFREAVRIQPDYAEAHYNLGLALHFKGDPEGALREVQEAQRQGYPPAPGVLPMLEERVRPSLKSDTPRTSP